LEPGPTAAPSVSESRRLTATSGCVSGPCSAGVALSHSSDDTTSGIAITASVRTGAAGLAVPAVLQPDGPVAECGAGAHFPAPGQPVNQQAASGIETPRGSEGVVLEVAPKVSNYRGGGLAVWVFASFTGAGAERTGRDWPAWKSRPDVRHWQRELTSANPSSSRTRIRRSPAINALKRLRWPSPVTPGLRVCGCPVDCRMAG
jgi:hypothetical protein